MGTIDPADFGEDADCEPIFDANRNLMQWESQLGTCGQELTQDGDELIFTKTLMVSTAVSFDSHMILARDS